MIKKFNYVEKHENDPLTHTEWNNLAQDVDGAVTAINTAINAINNGGGGGGIVSATDETESGGDPTVGVSIASGVLTIGSPKVIELTKKKKGVNTTLVSGNNVNIEPRESVGETKGGNISFKPGDDIEFCSHHRLSDNQDEVSIKVINGDGEPVKLLLNAAEMTITTKGKTGNDSNVFDVNINSNKNTKGYLKVRAQAIDLRCEKHGGIALLPKGYDSNGNMNKIKFEHGGGDGLEFGTFNPQKTSIFTDEYRFNKNGIWKMSVRETEASGKDIIDEREGGLQGLTATGAYKYKKNNSANNSAKALADLKTYEAADDFYDFIDTEDAQTTTEAIIKSAAALNNDFIETSLSSKKNLKISTSSNYKIVPYKHEIIDPGSASFDTEDPSNVSMHYDPTFNVDITRSYFKEELKLILSGTKKLSDYCGTNLPFGVEGQTGLFEIDGDVTPKIGIESEEEVDIDAKYGDVVLTSGDTVKVEAPEIRLNAINDDKSGGIVNFGATQDVIFLTNKLTKSLNVEAAANPTSIKILLQNNYQESVYWDTIEQVFRIPLKKLYLDDSHVTELTPSNYANGLAVYFEDGTRVPADYTCYIGYTTESGGVYTTNIYKTGTKGSENVLKKNLGEAVAQYTSSSASSLGTPVFNNTTNIKFELSNYVAGANVNTVGPEEFVTINSVELSDIITLVNYFKTGAGKQNGPWAV